MEKEWSWRDTGNHSPLIKAFNLASSISGYARKPFIAEQLMEKAVHATGLSDFGDPAFREGLDLLCKSYSQDSHVTGLGQMAGRGVIVASLSNRLRLVDWYKTHPEVSHEVIEKPWVITGLVRSGTTLSSNLLDLDPKVRTPLHWETDFPVPPSMLATEHADPRIAESEKKLAMLYKLSPPMKAIRAMEATRPEECLLIMQMDFKSYMFGSITSLATEYIEWYLHADKHSTYRLHKQLLQIWQSTVPTETWGLKAPNHMHGIVPLMATYPDARLIWNHRDPLVCIPSVTNLALSFLRIHQPDLDPAEAAHSYNNDWLAGIEKMIAYDKSRSDRGWCHHMYYKDIVRDPVATLSAAYQHFGETLEPVHERRIKAWVEQRPQHSFGKHKYSLEEFGLDPRKMREQYAEYIDRYNVPVEYKG